LIFAKVVIFIKPVLFYHHENIWNRKNAAKQEKRYEP